MPDIAANVLSIAPLQRTTFLCASFPEIRRSSLCTVRRLATTTCFGGLLISSPEKHNAEIRPRCLVNPNGA